MHLCNSSETRLIDSEWNHPQHDSVRMDLFVVVDYLWAHNIVYYMNCNVHLLSNSKSSERTILNQRIFSRRKAKLTIIIALHKEHSTRRGVKYCLAIFI